jgi:hypothetical protein
MKPRGTVTVKLGDQLISIHRVHLDTINPRHDPLVGDAEVIAQLCKEEKIGSLAKDIADMGALSPLESLGVVPMDGNPGHFICVEGNRRTCALILLHDPSRAPSGELRTLIKKVKQNIQIPKKVKVHIFANREAAKPWIDRRHLGEQEGVGTLPWDTRQKSRAVGNNKLTTAKANALALAVINRLELKEMITDEQSKAVSLTTLARYLSNPGLRAIFGLASSKELIYTHESEEVDRALLKLVLDSINKQVDGTRAVNSRTNSNQRLQYANQIKSAGLAPKTPLSNPEIPETPNEQNGSNKGINLKSARDPNKRGTLFEASQLFVPAKEDKVLLRLRKEALSLKIEDFPFSGNYLLRAIVERVMVLFLKKMKKYYSGMGDDKLVSTCASELANIGVTGTGLEVLKKAAGSRAQPFSLHSLGLVVHGGAIPDRKHLLGMADTWQPALTEMIKHF